MLTPRQRELLALLADGYSTKEAAGLMGISTETTKNHMTHILGRLQVRDRTAAIVVAMRHGLIEPFPERPGSRRRMARALYQAMVAAGAGRWGDTADFEALPATEQAWLRARLDDVLGAL